MLGFVFGVVLRHVEDAAFDVVRIGRPALSVLPSGFRVGSELRQILRVFLFKNGGGFVFGGPDGEGERVVHGDGALPFADVRAFGRREAVGGHPEGVAAFRNGVAPRLAGLAAEHVVRHQADDEDDEAEEDVGDEAETCGKGRRQRAHGQQ